LKTLNPLPYIKIMYWNTIQQKYHVQQKLKTTTKG
jgi:hypothetical protein